MLWEETRSWFGVILTIVSSIVVAVVRASALLRSQRGRKQPPARKVRGSGARKVVKIEEPVA